ncbi:ABC-F family ATP-binding cassette domain-containing protein [Mesohalobacter halotolerans]|uniref:Probable ATP-binding protein YbiT n=1 Tax=Mesohalobacter halotolerans TaxID=1883405 RepID=A0A4U5TRT1_9FLAO|nr:ABC-F family ATP-binding cassette domain-containing protein [Mesohalobacter halotolerans]MBS3739199.1 ABC-F family ATP-binding cassette domain-containing protein [Psychroflexus sp.]TKS56028.1 ABC-F family ATP-binding cassette domain-containing protein [Mesohalobacter halotolerans]
MLHTSELSLSFGGEYVFKNISFRLGANERIGLIGKNGAGKSTLLKVIAGEQEYDDGQISKDKEVSIGFLKQDIDFEEGRTVLEEAYQAFEDIKTIEQKLEHINTQLAEREDYESEAYNQLMIDLNTYQQQYEIQGGYNYQGETERILKGLGFKEEELNNLTNTFSGGWRMRIELAKLLLQQNDILLLDEPTNHLDIESIIWLEKFLNQSSACVVIVSHDKMFLDHVTNRTIEISLGKIYDFNKPFSKFKIHREELREQQLAAQKNQQNEVEHTEKLIDKFRAKANKASMAQSLIKKLDKIDRIEVEHQDTATMNIRFPVSKRAGKVIIKAEHISKSYKDNQVIKDISFTVDRGDKLAFVGQNGQGKSTLAKIIMNEISYQGHLEIGHNVEIGYFAQNQAEYLDENKTVLDTMIDAANALTRPKVRDILGSFLFSGDDVHKYVKVLSGGERNRLALAKMLLNPFNVLIMDEPTNHLDMQSKLVLKQALQAFDGTLILISHDRDFLQGLSETILEFKDSKVNTFLGSIEDYLKSREAEDFRSIEKRSESKTKKSSKPNDYQCQKKYKSLCNKLSKVESKITQHEKEIKSIDEKLAYDYDKTIAEDNFFDKYNTKKNNLDKLMKEWEQIQSQIDELDL